MPAAITIDVLTIDELFPAIAEHFGSWRPFRADPLPAAPGVYVWSSDRKVLYVGKAASLVQRVGFEKGLIAGHDPGRAWQVSVIHMLKVHNATVEWVATTTSAEAELLERRLIEWHRACTGIAPLAVGWEAKQGSPREAGERWAQDLWRRELGT